MQTLETGQQILSGLKETSKFFEQVSLLVRTAEDLIKEQGWNSANNSMKTFNISSHLHQPQRWMPSMVSRFFMNDDAKDILIYVGVIMNYETEWKGFDEPWVTCGLFQCISGKSPTEDMSLGWIDAHLVDKEDPDGKFQWGRMSIVDTKPLKLPTLRHSIFVYRLPGTGTPV